MSMWSNCHYYSVDEYECTFPLLDCCKFDDFIFSPLSFINDYLWLDVGLQMRCYGGMQSISKLWFWSWLHSFLLLDSFDNFYIKKYELQFRYSFVFLGLRYLLKGCWEIPDEGACGKMFELGGSRQVKGHITRLKYWF